LNPTLTPDGTVTSVGTSIGQAPVGFPDTGGAPAVESCDSWAVVLDIFATVGILIVSVGAILGLGYLLFRRR